MCDCAICGQAEFRDEMYGGSDRANRTPDEFTLAELRRRLPPDVLEKLRVPEGGRNYGPVKRIPGRHQ